MSPSGVRQKLMELNPLMQQDPLDWIRILELTAEHLKTQPGEDALFDLITEEGWAIDETQARLLQQETTDAFNSLHKTSLWSALDELEFVHPILDRLDKDAVLDLSSLANLRRWLAAIDTWSEIPRDEIPGDTLKKTIQRLPSVGPELNSLNQLLLPNGELNENVTPKIRQLSQDIRNLKLEITKRLDQIVKSLSQKGILQESFSDVRDGRYVVPVRVSAQSEVEGTLYESSVSGHSVYIEPKEITDLNQNLRKKENELSAEVYALLTKVSKELKPSVASIRSAVEILIHWDVTHAKACIAQATGGKPLQIEGKKISLKSIAHPLLWWTLPPEKITKNSIEFTEGQSALLLTGPNTGGKTVLLKTLGIAAIFARTGFLLPSESSSVFPYFKRVFADMGDPQSIESHLSSFSGHILRFNEILKIASTDSLVLMDELNSATDPEEGAALGRAVLETLLEKGAFIVATTHDPMLKTSAITDSRILSASMSFDEKNQTPTYHLVLGVPGRSRALETAERLGIPKSVLEKAKTYLSKAHLQIEEILQTIEKDRSELTRAKKETVRAQEIAEKLEAEWINKSKTSTQELLDKTRVRLRRLIESVQDEIRVMVKKLGESKSKREIELVRAQSQALLQKSNQELEKAFTEESPELAEFLTKETPEFEQSNLMDFQVGETVRVPKLKALGEVLEKHGNTYKIALGTLQMNLKENEIEKTTQPKIKKPQASPISFDVSEQSSFSNELDLRGKRLEEAMSELESYLDLAFRSKTYSEVRIIHGLGTGALREGTRKLLEQLPYIKSFQDAGASGGGTGATRVEFDY